MRSILSNFPTEEIVFHKQSGEIYNICALVGNGVISSEDISVPIEIDDFFERVLPNGQKEYYLVTDPGFVKGNARISDHYQSKVKNVKQMPLKISDNDDKVKPKMVFISHSTADKEYVKAFVDMLFGIGLKESDIVCSSYPGLGIPLGANIFDWLVEKFQKYDLYVLYFLSEYYYDSHVCLNEMGAAWVTKQKWDGILLPGFSFSDVDGCIDSHKIAISFDSDLEELKHRLGELKADITSFFDLTSISETRWEKLRNDLISQIRTIEMENFKKDDSIDGQNPNGQITISMKLDEGLLLVYAADDSKGTIFVTGSITRSGPIIETHGYDFAKEDTPRECARWKAAVDKLETYGLIEDIKQDGKCYRVTDEGFKTADILKKEWFIDTAKSPYEYFDR